MREILFRGKSVNTGEWIIGDYEHFYLSDGELVVYISEWGKRNDKVLPETVGQYTGLTDKYGTKIFEGDIILFEDESPTNYEYHDCTEMRCGEINFDDGEFSLRNRIAVEMDDLIYDGKLDGEIVGNIHDNSELLKGENRALTEGVHN